MDNGVVCQLSQVENSRQGPLTLHQLLVIGVEETEILIMR